MQYLLEYIYLLDEISIQIPLPMFVEIEKCIRIRGLIVINSTIKKNVHDGIQKCIKYPKQGSSYKQTADFICNKFQSAKLQGMRIM